MLEVIACSGLLLAFYQFLLARKVPYRAARRFLLASALLSVVIPALRLPILPAETVYLQIPMGAEPAGVSAPAAETTAAPVATAATFPWQGVLAALYGAVALLLLAVLVRNLARSKVFIRDRAPRAIISLGLDKGTSYLKFYSVQKLLKQAFDEVRDEQARSRYGKALAELTSEEREAILMAVPLNITEMEMIDRPQPTAF